MKQRSALRQRGAALLIMVTIISLGATWYLVSRLNTESGLAGAAAKARNTKVLNQAKAALIGYVASQAAIAGENRPGALPCPVAPGNFNDAANDGIVSYPCTLPIVGRFPWKTMGLEKLVDVSGEPLWYAVASGWAGAGTVINSDCTSASSGMACATGRLTVDGATSDVIALIIAPGPRLNVSASTNCTAWNQARSTTGSPDARNYLECQNATWPADASFASTGPGGSFNDQVVTITVTELMPAIEAAIAKRIALEIVPELNRVYKPSVWGFSGADPALAPGYADGKPLYPWAAPFANPGPGAGTSSYAGAAGTYQGLLPFNQVNCTASASNPRCLPGAALTSWASSPDAYDGGGWGYIQTQSCWWETGNAARVCEGEYHENDTYPSNPGMRIEMQATLRNVAMGLRRLDSTRMQVEARNDGSATWLAQAVSYAPTMNSDGSLTIRFWADLPNIDSMGWGTYAQYRIRMERLVMNDHALLDTTDPTTGWFARNEWYRVLYYSVARGFTTDALAAAVRETACPTSTSGSPIYPFNSSCLTVTNVAPAGRQRAILILAGRGINGNPRPSAALADYLEFGNRTGNFEKQTVTGVGLNLLVDTGAVNAYAVAAPAVIGKPFQFKAVNANSGASTLNAAAAGAKWLLNADGSPLAAAQIQADAVIEATYDGTDFRLAKRPFNDRVIVVGSN
ncbi:MAG: hypothetical protein IT513_14200 [Burkholderiales bacterium]|nr:hypothetical protein [Burkholderiales bacterium]